MYLPTSKYQRPRASIKVHCGRSVSVMIRVVRPVVDRMSDHAAVGIAPKVCETPLDKLYITPQTSFLRYTPTSDPVDKVYHE